MVVSKVVERPKNSKNKKKEKWLNDVIPDSLNKTQSKSTASPFDHLNHENKSKAKRQQQRKGSLIAIYTTYILTLVSIIMTTATSILLTTLATAIASVSALILFVAILWISYYRYLSYRCRRRTTMRKHQHHHDEDATTTVIIGFFHPHCSSGGGGERVLWKMVQVLEQMQQQSSSSSSRQFSRIHIVIYTIDPPTSTYKKGKIYVLLLLWRGSFAFYGLRVCLLLFLPLLGYNILLSIG